MDEQKSVDEQKLFEEQKTQYLSDMRKYISSLKTKMIIAYIFFFVSLAVITASFILYHFGLISPDTSTTIALIGYFIPAVYTLPMAIKTMDEATVDVEPSYDLYLHSDGRITAQEDTHTQGQRLGNLTIIIFTFIVYLLISPIILVVRTIKNEIKYKTAIKNYKKAQIEE